MADIPQIQYIAPNVKNSGWFGRTTDSDQALRGIYNTNATNVAIANAQNMAQYQMFQEANNYNTAMWNAQNQYNLPTAQVQRMLAAGINPRVGIQGGNSGTANSSPTSETPPQLHSPNILAPTDAYRMHQDAKFQTLDAIGNVIGNTNSTITSLAQSRLANSQASLNEVDALTRLARNKSEINSLLAQGRKTGLEADVIEETKPYTIKQAEVTADSIAKDNQLKDIDLTIKREYGLNIAEAELQNLYNDASLKLSQATNENERYEIMQKEKDRIAQEILNLKKQGKVIDQQVNTLKAQENQANAGANQANATADNTRENTKIVQRTADYIVNQAAYNSRGAYYDALQGKQDYEYNQWQYDFERGPLGRYGRVVGSTIGQLLNGRSTLYRMRPGKK